MEPTLQAKLMDILDRLNPEFRSTGQRDIDALVAAGVASYDDILVVVGNDAMSDQVRAAAAWTLGRLGEPRAIPSLMTVSEGASAEVRGEAVRALGEIRPSDGAPIVEFLARRLLHDPDAEVRSAAAYALGLVGGESALGPLVSTLTNAGENVRIRGFAAEALAALGDRRAVPALIAALSNPSPEVRFWSAYALGELGDSRGIGALENLAASDDAYLPGWGAVGAEAAAAIARIEESGG